jgi:hypothetical protein
MITRIPVNFSANIYGRTEPKRRVSFAASDQFVKDTEHSHMYDKVKRKIGYAKETMEPQKYNGLLVSFVAKELNRLPKFENDKLNERIELYEEIADSLDKTGENYNGCVGSIAQYVNHVPPIERVRALRFLSGIVEPDLPDIDVACGNIINQAKKIKNNRDLPVILETLAGKIKPSRDGNWALLVMAKEIPFISSEKEEKIEALYDKISMKIYNEDPETAEPLLKQLAKIRSEVIDDKTFCEAE